MESLHIVTIILLILGEVFLWEVAKYLGKRNSLNQKAHWTRRMANRR